MLLFHFLFGSFFGSFLCLVAERLPRGQSIIFPASHCLYCKKKLNCFDLIPLLSILFLNFHCRYCKQKLPSTYFFSELISGILWISLVYTGNSSAYYFLFFFSTYLLSLTDIFYLLVEPKLFYPMVVSLSFYHLLSGRSFHFLFGSILCVSLLGFLYYRPHSIGGGDVLLLIFWGTLLGSFTLLFILFIASGTGLMFIFFTRQFTKVPIKKIPFVPFLTVGLYLSLLCQLI